MKNRIIVALISLVCGCRSAAAEITDDCHPPVISEVIDPLGASGTLEVQNGLDSVGNTYQSGFLFLASSRAVGPSLGVFMTINGQKQNTTVWNGRVVGSWRPEPVDGLDLDECYCTNTMGFWRVPVGFGTIGEDPRGSTDPGYSVVGHPLTEGQRIQVRLDLCNTNGCTEGTPRDLVVHIVP